MEAPVIRLESVTTTYEGASRPVIRGIDLVVGRGEFVIVGGPNGAGKTTLLETIAGLLPIVRGRAEVCGLDAARQGCALRKRVGYVLQTFDFDAFTPFTVEEVMLMARFGVLGALRRPGSEDRAAVEEALALLKIADLRTSHIGKLSGGQQQKVLIAHNLAKRPEVLLLDEPFSSLDLAARDAVCAVLHGVAERGVALVLVSHAFDSLPDRDVRVVVMRAGSIVLNEVMEPAAVQARVRAVSDEP